MDHLPRREVSGKTPAEGRPAVWTTTRSTTLAVPLAAARRATEAVAVQLPDLLAVQDGLLHRRQALAAGVTRSALAHRLRPDGPWRLVAPAVVAACTGVLTERQRWRVALLYVESGADHATGDLALLGGATACLAHGLTALPADPSAAVHVLADQRVRRRAAAPGIVVKRTTRLPAPRWREGLPVVPLQRAVVDACRPLVLLRDFRALVAEAVQTRRTTVERLAQQMDAGESTGSALLRRALEEVGWGARSVPEAEVARDLRRSALPRAQWNRSLLSLEGTWIADPDAWWPQASTVLEIDSHRWHLGPLQAEETMARRERLTRHGLLVVQISPAQYREDRAGFRARLAETLAVGATLPPARVVDAAAFRLRHAGRLTRLALPAS